MADYISREEAVNSLMPIVKSASLRNRNVYSTAKKCLEVIESLPGYSEDNIRGNEDDKQSKVSRTES